MNFYLNFAAMKYFFLIAVFLFSFSSCSKKSAYNSVKQQALMSDREARKRIKSRHKVAKMDKSDCPTVKKNRKEKRLAKKESKKQEPAGEN